MGGQGAEIFLEKIPDIFRTSSRMVGSLILRVADLSSISTDDGELNKNFATSHARADSWAFKSKSQPPKQTSQIATTVAAESVSPLLNRWRRATARVAAAFSFIESILTRYPSGNWVSFLHDDAFFRNGLRSGNRVSSFQRIQDGRAEKWGRGETGESMVGQAQVVLQ